MDPAPFGHQALKSFDQCCAGFLVFGPWQVQNRLESIRELLQGGQQMFGVSRSDGLCEQAQGFRHFNTLVGEGGSHERSVKAEAWINNQVVT